MEETDKKADFKKYLPVLVIALVAFFSSLALASAHQVFSRMVAMSYFMGMFLVIFSMFKLFDIKSFAGGFKKYDLISARYPVYAYLYPFFELLLGLGYMSFFLPILVNILTVALMGATGAGVAKAVQNREKISCACLGATFDIPLGYVSLFESVLMGAMAVTGLMNAIIAVF